MSVVANGSFLPAADIRAVLQQTDCGLSSAVSRLSSISATSFEGHTGLGAPGGGGPHDWRKSAEGHEVEEIEGPPFSVPPGVLL